VAAHAHDLVRGASPLGHVGEALGGLSVGNWVAVRRKSAGDNFTRLLFALRRAQGVALASLNRKGRRLSKPAEGTW